MLQKLSHFCRFSSFTEGGDRLINWNWIVFMKFSDDILITLFFNQSNETKNKINKTFWLIFEVVCPLANVCKTNHAFRTD